LAESGPWHAAPIRRLNSLDPVDFSRRNTAIVLPLWRCCAVSTCLGQLPAA